MRRIGLVIACLTALPGCVNPSTDAEDQAPSVATLGSGERAAWLGRRDRVDPAVWLANRAVRRQLSPADPEVVRLREALTRANAYFLESSRMLANRTAQIGEMLAAHGFSEDYAALLDALSSVAAAAGSKQTYGEVGQHYFNLRRSGVEKAAALAALSERYGVQRKN